MSGVGVVAGFEGSLTSRQNEGERNEREPYTRLRLRLWQPNRFGRRLRPHDYSRDNGVLSVQIQRTRSGLGASPNELMNGGVPALRFNVSRSRKRYSHTVEMRCDADGSKIQLPVWLHRPLPEPSRIKATQLAWRRNMPCQESGAIA